MEWQLVGEFFDWISSEYYSGTTFNDPDPKNQDTNGKPKQLKFCQYLKSQWDRNHINSAAFALSEGGRKLLPLQHIAAVYPSTSTSQPGYDFHSEFVGLQKKINAPAKSSVSPLCLWTHFRHFTNEDKEF